MTTVRPGSTDTSYFTLNSSATYASSSGKNPLAGTFFAGDLAAVSADAELKVNMAASQSRSGETSRKLDHVKRDVLRPPLPYPGSMPENETSGRRV